LFLLLLESFGLLLLKVLLEMLGQIVLGACGDMTVLQGASRVVWPELTNLLEVDFDVSEKVVLRDEGVDARMDLVVVEFVNVVDLAVAFVHFAVELTKAIVHARYALLGLTRLLLRSLVHLFERGFRPS
jgi:hypothetical protein